MYKYFLLNINFFIIPTIILIIVHLVSIKRKISVRNEFVTSKKQ